MGDHISAALIFRYGLIGQACEINFVGEVAAGVGIVLKMPPFRLNSAETDRFHDASHVIHVFARLLCPRSAAVTRRGIVKCVHRSRHLKLKAGCVVDEGHVYRAAALMP